MFVAIRKKMKILYNLPIVCEMEVFDFAIPWCPRRTQPIKVFSKCAYRCRLDTIYTYFHNYARTNNKSLLRLLLQVIKYTCEDIKVETDFSFFELHMIMDHLLELATLIIFFEDLHGASYILFNLINIQF